MSVKRKITASMDGARVIRKPSPLQQTITQTNEVANDQTVLVSTAEQDLAVGDLTTPKYVLLRNASASTTSLITYGPKTSSGGTQDFGVLAYGIEDSITLSSTAVIIRVRASTANTSLDTRMWDA